MTDTERILIKMLKENTGSHFLDSGGTYGRNWQRNQARLFKKEPEATLNITAWKGKEGKPDGIALGITLSVFHFLSEALEYSPKIDKQFQAYARREEFKDEGWLAIAESFAQYYATTQETGKTRPPVHTFNSYNGEDYLSQVIQGVIIGEYEGIVLLQIHGGCDVRGGYTKPRVFRFNDDWDVTLADNARGSIYCDGKHGWSIEPGYSQGWNDEPALDSFPVQVLGKEEKPVIGKLCAREDDSEAFCPICSAKLHASR
jgi:hypothetical protein